MSDINGIVVLDAGVLIDLLVLSKRGQVIQKLLLDDIIDARATEMAILETKYILCRKLGWERTFEQMHNFLSSNYVVIKEIGPYIDQAAKYKCQRSLSLPDCITLSLAKNLEVPAIFSVKEKEFEKEIVKNPFDVEIFFLEDYIH